MKTLTCRNAYLSLALLSGLLVAGCGKEPHSTPTDGTGVAENDTPAGYPRDKDAHQHPETLAEAVSQLEALRDTIRDGFANGDADAAHGPLHDVGHVLNEVKVLAAKEITDPAQSTRINDAVASLFASFGAVDALLHKKEGKEYSEVSADIDRALNEIRTATTVPSAAETDAEATDPAEAEADDSSEAKKE